MQSICPKGVKEGGGRPLEGCGPVFQKQREREREIPYMKSSDFKMLVTNSKIVKTLYGPITKLAKENRHISQL